jgi:TonB family protein
MHQLAINPNVDPYVVKVPPMLAQEGATFNAIVRLCVSAEGNVTSVQIQRGAGPAIDSQIPSVMGRWRYRPLIRDGQPVPFCYAVNYQVSAR